MSRLLILSAALLLACPQQPRLSVQTRRGPPDERRTESGPDPFEGRRDVEMRPSLYVRGRDETCSASLYLGPQACFVRGAKVVGDWSREIPDSGLIEMPPSVPFEYWLECSEVAYPCDAETPVTCVCRTP